MTNILSNIKPGDLLFEFHPQNWHLVLDVKTFPEEPERLAFYYLSIRIKMRFWFMTLKSSEENRYFTLHPMCPENDFEQLA